MRINYDFLDLEAFLAVKESGSFQEAATRLHLSQSSVTRRIQKLEDALGTLLFERTTRDVRPTLAAKRLQIRAETILQEAHETARAMRDETEAFAHQRAQTVTVATIPTAVRALVTPALQEVLASKPIARIRLLDLAANEVAEAVAEGEADFGVCSIPMLEPATEFSLLLNDPMVIAFPKSHGLARKRTVSWTDLEGERLILPARGTGNRLLIDEALARSQTSVKWMYEVGRTSTALELVSDGIGLAPIPMMAIASGHAANAGWKHITGPDVSRPIGLISRPASEESDAVRSLKGKIQRLAASRPGTDH